jgi:hypothetical protein
MNQAPFRTLSTMAGLAACMWSVGCVREVISGEDPQARTGRITGSNARDSLVIRLPWMEAPAPRMLFGDRLLAYETVQARLTDGTERFVLRSLNSVETTVTVRAKLQEDGAMEFAYRVDALPAGYSVDVVFDLRPQPVRPSIELWTNGAPVKVAPGTEVVSVQLSRDAPTRITARPAPTGAPAKP